MREFYTLALDEVLNGQLFVGCEYAKRLSCDCRCVRGGGYYMAGQLISMALVHSGLGPHWLGRLLLESI